MKNKEDGGQVHYVKLYDAPVDLRAVMVKLNYNGFLPLCDLRPFNTLIRSSEEVWHYLEFCYFKPSRREKGGGGH